MNDEIKEILRYLRIENGHCSSELSYEETHLLLDYITNLQEENEKYKKIFEGKERFSKIMPEDIDFIILSKSDYDRQEKDIQLELIDYKSRCEKATEFIEKSRVKATPFFKQFDGDLIMPKREVDKLLIILNGGE